MDATRRLLTTNCVDEPGTDTTQAAGLRAAAGDNAGDDGADRSSPSAALDPPSPPPPPPLPMPRARSSDRACEGRMGLDRAWCIRRNLP
jgi:hypothetical protein